MPDIISTTSQKKGWELANALREFLPGQLEWKDVGGYPILYRKGFWGSFKGIVFLGGDKKRITIESRRWKDAILEAVQKYKDAKGITIEVKYTFDVPKKNKKSW